jgi:hypothetical protein
MKECLREYFVTLMNNNNVEKIKCPHDYCKSEPYEWEL